MNLMNGLLEIALNSNIRLQMSSAMSLFQAQADGGFATRCFLVHAALLACKYTHNHT